VQDGILPLKEQGYKLYKEHIFDQFVHVSFFATPSAACSEPTTLIEIPTADRRALSAFAFVLLLHRTESPHVHSERHSARACE
jgi:hypothetical protein